MAAARAAGGVESTSLAEEIAARRASMRDPRTYNSAALPEMDIRVVAVAVVARGQPVDATPGRETLTLWGGVRNYLVYFRPDLREFFAHKPSYEGENLELSEILARDFAFVHRVKFEPIPHFNPPLFSRIFCIATVTGRTMAQHNTAAVITHEADDGWHTLHNEPYITKFYVACLDRETDTLKVRIENDERSEPLNAAINRDFFAVQKMHYVRF